MACGNVSDVAKVSIELNNGQMYDIYCHCILYPGFYNQLRVFFYSKLEDGYGLISHFSLMACHYPCFITQHFLAVQVDVMPILKAAEVFFILSIIIGTVTYHHGRGMLNESMTTHQLRVGRLISGHTIPVSVAVGHNTLVWGLLGCGCIVLVSGVVGVGGIVCTSTSGGVGRIVAVSLLAVVLAPLADPSVASVSNSSELLEQFQDRVRTRTEPFKRVLPHEKPRPLLIGQFQPDNPALPNPEFLLHLSFWVLIV